MMSRPKSPLVRLRKVLLTLAIRVIESLLLVAFFTGMDLLIPLVQNPWTTIPVVWDRISHGGNIVWILILVAVLYITRWDVSILRLPHRLGESLAVPKSLFKSLLSHPDRAVGFTALICFAYPLLTVGIILEPFFGSPLGLSTWWLIWEMIIYYLVMFLNWRKFSVFKLEKYSEQKHLIWAETWWCFQISTLIEQLLIIPLVAVYGLVGLYQYTQGMMGSFGLLAMHVFLVILIPMVAWMSLNVFIDIPRDTGIWWSLLGSESLARIGLCEAEKNHTERAQEFARSSLRMVSGVFAYKRYTLGDLVKCQQVLRLARDLKREVPSNGLKSMLQAISRPQNLADYPDAVSNFLSDLRWPSYLNETKDPESQFYGWLGRWLPVVAPMLAALVGVFSETIRTWFGQVANSMGDFQLIGALLIAFVPLVTYQVFYKSIFEIRLQLKDIDSLSAAIGQ
jgi:hypothetical protein